MPTISMFYGIFGIIAYFMDTSEPNAPAYIHSVLSGSRSRVWHIPSADSCWLVISLKQTSLGRSVGGNSPMS